MLVEHAAERLDMGGGGVGLIHLLDELEKLRDNFGGKT
jgi:hypothetical protein